MSKQSPQWLTAEEAAKDLEPEFVSDKKTIDFCGYLNTVFQMPLLMENTINIGDFLTSRLEGTSYMPASGKVRYIKKLLADLQVFYSGMNNMVTRYSVLQKILLGEITNLYEVCQVAIFLGIPAEELCNPVLPEKSQKERFQETVVELTGNGLGSHRIAKQIGCSPCTVLHERNSGVIAPRFYPGHAGKKRQDWQKLDAEAVPAVRQLCEQIYHGTGGDGGRPGKVSKITVNRLMGWPRERIKYYSKCCEIVESYKESWPEYWARELDWAWGKLSKEKPVAEITWTNIYNLTSVRTKDLPKCIRYIKSKDIRILLSGREHGD